MELTEQDGDTLAYVKALDSITTENLYGIICAFLNTKGGRIIFGVDDGRVVGLRLEGKELDDFLIKIGNIYLNKIIVDYDGNPPDSDAITAEFIRESSILIIHVIHRGRRFILGNSEWIRLGSSNYREIIHEAPAVKPHCFSCFLSCSCYI